MTKNRRLMISVTPEINAKLEKLKKKSYYDKTYSDMLRNVIAAGLEATKKKSTK